jgi:hypothetical protein
MRAMRSPPALAEFQDLLLFDHRNSPFLHTSPFWRVDHEVGDVVPEQIAESF